MQTSAPYRLSLDDRPATIDSRLEPFRSASTSSTALIANAAMIDREGCSSTIVALCRCPKVCHTVVRSVPDERAPKYAGDETEGNHRAHHVTASAIILANSFFRRTNSLSFEIALGARSAMLNQDLITIGASDFSFEHRAMLVSEFKVEIFQRKLVVHHIRHGHEYRFPNASKRTVFAVEPSAQPKCEEKCSWLAFRGSQGGSRYL